MAHTPKLSLPVVGSLESYYLRVRMEKQRQKQLSAERAKQRAAAKERKQ